MQGCEICGTIRNMDHHHVIPKRMGGSKNPTVQDESNLMTLCRSCHRNLHEGRWDLVRSPEGIWVFDKHTGEQVMRRLHNPEVDPPSLFQILNVAEDILSRLLETLPYLSDDQLKEAFTYACSFGQRSWVVQAAIMYEAQQRSTYVTVPWKLSPVASESANVRPRSMLWSGRLFSMTKMGKKTSTLTHCCWTRLAGTWWRLPRRKSRKSGWPTLRTGRWKTPGIQCRPSGGTSSGPTFPMVSITTVMLGQSRWNLLHCPQWSGENVPGSSPFAPEPADRCPSKSALAASLPGLSIKRQISLNPLMEHSIAQIRRKNR